MAKLYMAWFHVQAVASQPRPCPRQGAAARPASPGHGQRAGSHGHAQGAASERQPDNVNKAQG
jgi:hypothetical protein